jgi:hypothetical protein
VSAMAQTPYAETEALIAVMSEDEDEALRILDDMLPGERRRFVDQLDRLSLLADDTQRCPRCRKLVDPLASVMRASVGTGQWHRDCLEAQRAEQGCEGDES